MIQLTINHQNLQWLIQNTDFYVLVVALTTQDNARQLQQLKSGFQKKINWSKY